MFLKISGSLYRLLLFFFLTAASEPRALQCFSSPSCTTLHPQPQRKCSLARCCPKSSDPGYFWPTALPHKTVVSGCVQSQTLLLDQAAHPSEFRMNTPSCIDPLTVAVMEAICQTVICSWMSQLPQGPALLGRGRNATHLDFVHGGYKKLPYFRKMLCLSFPFKTATRILIIPCLQRKAPWQIPSRIKDWAKVCSPWWTVP